MQGAAIALLAKLFDDAVDATAFLEKGKQEMLYVVLQLILRAKPSERKTIFQQSRKTIVNLAMLLCAVLTNLYPTASKRLSANANSLDECGCTGGRW